AYNCGLPVVSPEPSDVISALSQLQESEQWLALAQGAWQAALGIFDANSIHDILKKSIFELVHQSFTQSANLSSS
ncbi:MAG: hypothetical protein VKL42_06140, partial [Snowella sp.]|nr:hypothetical protein [Snowella sp.]